MATVQETIDNLISYIDAAVAKHSVSNRHVATVLEFLNSGLKTVRENLSSLNDKYLNKKEDDVAEGNVTFKKDIKSDDFVPGDLMGSGWSIYKDSNGSTVIEVDKIVARASLSTSELIVNQETFSKGSSIYVKAGCTITDVEELAGCYRCYYDNEEGQCFSGFKVGDQARCQRYDASYSDIVKYYWRLVVGIGDDYVDLSKVDCDGTGIPAAGDDIAQLGHRSDKGRQSAIVLSPDDSGSVVVWAGIDSYSLSEKNMVGMGVNPVSGRAYLYGYGDMFFGDRSLKKNFITYQVKDGDTEPTLLINADVQLGADSTGLSNLSDFTKLKDEVGIISGRTEREFTVWYYEHEPTLENEPAVNWTTDELKAVHDQDIYFSDQLSRAWRFVNGRWVEITDERTLSAIKIAEEAKAAASEVNNYIANVLSQELQGLQDQLDGTIDSFFYSYDPSVDNYPASEWDTDSLRDAHLNDTFTNLNTGYSWRWTKNEGEGGGVLYGWTEIKDTATVKALSLAGEAKDTADGKRRVFVDIPYVPYDKGDLWVQGESGDILRCITSRLTGSYDKSDWEKASKYTDDTVANEANVRLNDLEYLKTAFGHDTSVLEGGVLMGEVVGVVNADGKVGAFINGSDFAEDDSHGKLVFAGGIPSEVEGTAQDLETRARHANTRIYEDGHVESKSADISGVVRVGTLIHKTLYPSADDVSESHDLAGYSLAISRGSNCTFILPVLTDEYVEIKVIHFALSRTGDVCYVATPDGQNTICFVDSSNYNYISTTNRLELPPGVLMKFVSVGDLWYVTVEQMYSI